jgi:hypothetical protein
VPYADHGPNVKRGEVNVQCPFCGSADPSKHMGLNLTTGWWSCWRNRAQHSGKSPLRLIMALLRVPYWRAREIAGFGEGYVDPEGFDALAARLMRREGIEARPEQVQRRRLFLGRPEFIPMSPSGRSRRHWAYLRDERGFDEDQDVELLCELYDIHAGVVGDFHDRVVLPYYEDGELVTWTGRAIGTSSMRYRDLDVDQSIVKPKETLYNHDAIPGGGSALVLVEGPLDVLKLDFYGRVYGVRAVGLSTNSISEEQAYLLQEAVDKFREVLVMMDNATTLGVVDSMRMKQNLRFFGEDAVRIVPVPAGRKDAGECSPREIMDWARALEAK